MGGEGGGKGTGTARMSCREGNIHAVIGKKGGKEGGREGGGRVVNSVPDSAQGRMSACVSSASWKKPSLNGRRRPFSVLPPSGKTAIGMLSDK